MKFELFNRHLETEISKLVDPKHRSVVKNFCGNLVFMIESLAELHITEKIKENGLMGLEFIIRELSLFNEYLGRPGNIKSDFGEKFVQSANGINECISQAKKIAAPILFVDEIVDSMKIFADFLSEGFLFDQNHSLILLISSNRSAMFVEEFYLKDTLIISCDDLPKYITKNEISYSDAITLMKLRELVCLSQYKKRFTLKWPKNHWQHLIFDLSPMNKVLPYSSYYNKTAKYYISSAIAYLLSRNNDDFHSSFLQSKWHYDLMKNPFDWAKWNDFCKWAIERNVPQSDWAKDSLNVILEFSAN